MLLCSFLDSLLKQFWFALRDHSRLAVVLNFVLCSRKIDLLQKFNTVIKFSAQLLLPIFFVKKSKRKY